MRFLGAVNGVMPETPKAEEVGGNRIDTQDEGQKFFRRCPRRVRKNSKNVNEAYWKDICKL